MKIQLTRPTILKLLGIVFIIFFVHRCTVINFNFFMPSGKSVPDLSKTLKNKTFELFKVTGSIWNEIRYHPQKDYFLIAQDKRITKLDSRGSRVYYLDMKERDPSGMPDNMDYNAPSSFVISWYGIYDLSKDKPTLEEFSKIINTDGNMDEDTWKREFQKLYQSSDIAFWGYRKGLQDGELYPLYFRQNSQWIVLYTNEYSSVYRMNNYPEIRLGDSIIPEKCDRLYLLKDIQHNDSYSDYLTSGNQYDFSNEPESKLKYGKRASVKTLYFKKEEVEDGPYTIIPVQFSGTAVNKLQFENSSITFKSIAQKDAGLNFSPIETDFFIFEVADEFKKANTPSFLYYKYPTSWNSDDNEGVYVIRKINNK